MKQFESIATTVSVAAYANSRLCGRFDDPAPPLIIFYTFQVERWSGQRDCAVGDESCTIVGDLSNFAVQYALHEELARFRAVKNGVGTALSPASELALSIIPNAGLAVRSNKTGRVLRAVDERGRPISARVLDARLRRRARLFARDHRGTEPAARLIHALRRTVPRIARKVGGRVAAPKGARRARRLSVRLQRVAQSGDDPEPAPPLADSTHEYHFVDAPRGPPRGSDNPNVRFVRGGSIAFHEEPVPYESTSSSLRSRESAVARPYSRFRADVDTDAAGGDNDRYRCGGRYHGMDEWRLAQTLGTRAPSSRRRSSHPARTVRGLEDRGAVALRAARPATDVSNGSSSSDAPLRRYFTTKAAAAYCSLTPEGLRSAMQRGLVRPAGRRGGGRHFMWRIEDLDAYLVGVAPQVGSAASVGVQGGAVGPAPVAEPGAHPVTFGVGGVCREGSGGAPVTTPPVLLAGGESPEGSGEVRFGEAPSSRTAVMSVEEAAERLGIHRATLGRMIADGSGPPARRVGSGRRARILIHRAAFEEWLSTGEEPARRRRGRRSA